MRPAPWRPRPIPTVWLDYTTGAGIDDAGRTVKPVIGGRRKRPQLVDLLETARANQATRIMLTGKVPAPIPGREHWLISPTPNWTPSGHWLEDPPTGRFHHPMTDARVEVRLAREWFGDGDYSARDARDAWQLVEAALHQHAKGARMALSPAATGMYAWASSLPKDYWDEPLDDELTELLRRTSGQHRIEHMVAGPSRCKCRDCPPLVTEPELPAFVYIDGRFMYAALLRELGTGPAYRLTEQQAAELAANSPYAKARYRVRAKVPAMWDTCGVLGAQLDDGEHWHYPNRPGAVFETWCDAVELHTARGVGWRVDVLEGIQFSKGRPADTFRDRLLKARDHLAQVDAPEHISDLGRAAMRAILLQTVGVWHSRGRDRTVVAWSVNDLPPHAIETMREYNATNQAGETVPAYVYRERASSNQQAEAFRRPELSSQVWARARARIFLGPSADPTGQKPNLPLSSGALEVDPAYLIGINGDALYVGTKTVPTWALPTDQGGGDDGREGRLRLRGYLPGPIATPATDRDRNRLRAQAEAADWSAYLAQQRDEEPAS